MTTQINDNLTRFHEMRNQLDDSSRWHKVGGLPHRRSRHERRRAHLGQGRPDRFRLRQGIRPMTAPDLSILIRVEKLLAQAADPSCTEPEREAFQEKAFELIERHRIDRAAIGGHLAADDELGTFKLGRFNGVYGRVRIQVVQAVADNLDVQIFWRGYQNTRNLHAYGFKSDVERVQALTDRLLADADLRVASLQPDPTVISNYADDGSRYKSERGAILAATVRERRGFYVGYADAVRSRLHRATKAATAAHREETSEAQAESVALVLVDRARQVRESYRAVHPGIKSASSVTSAGFSGHSEGYAAGSQADLTDRNAVRSQKALGR